MWKLTEAMIKYAVKFAEKRGELLIGIHPDSSLGHDIMRQNAIVIELNDEVKKLRRDLAKFVPNFPRDRISPNWGKSPFVGVDKSDVVDS